MAYAWASEKERYRGRLQVNGWGNVGNMAPGNVRITTDHTTIDYVDVGTQGLRFKETMQGDKSVLTQDDSGNWFTRGGEFYGLPWTVGYAARTQLGPTHRRFLTPTLNGCCVIVSGTRAAPVVVHANAQAATLLAPLGGDLPRYFARWSDVYVTVVSQLTAQGLIPDDDLEMLTPSMYSVPGVANAAVFGVQEGASWSFYYVMNQAAGGTTQRFWPA